MNTVKLMLGLIFMMCLGVMCVMLLQGGSGQPQERATSANEALTFWDSAIAAKGDNHALSAVENLVVRRYGRGDKPTWVTLAVLPDRYWIYVNTSATPLGKQITVGDLRLSTTVRQLRRNGPASVSQLEAQRPGMLAYAMGAVVTFLLKTRWFALQPLSVEERKLGKKLCKVVVAELAGFRARYFFAPETLQLVRIEAISGVARSWLHGEHIEFSDYRSVNGIRMPRSVKYSQFGRFHVEFEINADYDPAIFGRDPSMENGPDGWRQVR